MKTIVTILIGFVFTTSHAQLTYVPDDIFEMTLETYYPFTDNGVANDNYVLTSGIEQFTDFSFNTFQQVDIQDLTGLEAFINIKKLSLMVNFKYINILDVESMGLQLESLTIHHQDSLQAIAVGDANFKKLELINCKRVEEIDFGPISTMDSATFHLYMLPELTNLNFSEVNFGLNNRVTLSQVPKLSELTFGSVSDTNIYKYFIDSPLDLHCVQVSNVSYFSSLNTITTAGWPIAYHQPTNYYFSVDCSNPLSTFESKKISIEKKVLYLTDLLGRKVPSNTVGVLLEVYEDGSTRRIYRP